MSEKRIKDLEDLENYTRVIIYDSNDGGAVVYVDGEYFCDMDYYADSAIKLLQLGNETDKPLCVCDLWISDVEDPYADKVIEVFNDMIDLIPPEQEILLLNKEYDKL